MKKIPVFLLVFFTAIVAKAQNPIVPPGVYIADPSVHVWSDGKIYVYGSRDESAGYYCSKSYRVMSSSDLITWELSGTSFASEGPNDQVPYSDSYLYAPDAQYANGRYYLYYCLAMRGDGTEGVAVSDSPNGPFLNGIPINVGGFNQIDPSVFIDDDGQAYYIWGQFNAKIAKMKPKSMIEIDTTTILENVVTEEEHYFHEGAYMVKHNGLYYLVYADVSRGGAPTCIGYSTSKSPMGPYTYRGVIIDNKFSDPGVWNNHGSLVEFNGQWYVFYHRSTHNSRTMRKTCLEPVTFREDGSIPEVQMTSQGAAGPLNAFEEIDAARACMLTGNVRINTVASDNEVLAGIHNGDLAVYRYLDFHEGASSITLRVSPGSKASRMIVSVGSRWTGMVGTVDIPAKESDKWITVKAAIQPVTGVHALWLSFSDPAQRRFGDNTEGEMEEIELCKVDSFQFNAASF